MVGCLVVCFQMVEKRKGVKEEGREERQSTKTKREIFLKTMERKGAEEKKG